MCWSSTKQTSSSHWKLNRIICIICILCAYICHYIFPFFYLDIFYFFLTHWDRKHYYIIVVESIQFVWAGNSVISRVLCNANTYRSIHEGLFFNSSPALDLKYSLRLPYIHFYFSSLHFVYNIKLMASINISTNQIDSYIWVVCQTTRPTNNSNHSKGLVGL